MPESWDNWVYKGRGGAKRCVVRNAQAYWVCGSCVHPTLFLSRRLLNKLFEGYLFSFVATHVFVVSSVVIVVVLIFFQPKSMTAKTKIVRDQKLVENADRIFKRFWPGSRDAADSMFQTFKQPHLGNRAKKGLKMQSAFSTNFRSLTIFVLTVFDFG